MEYETHQVLLQRISQHADSLRVRNGSVLDFPRKLGEKIAELFGMAPELCTVGELDEVGNFHENSFGGSDGAVEFLVRIDFPVPSGGGAHFDIPVSAVADGGRYLVQHPRGSDVVTYAPMIDESALEGVAKQIVIQANINVSEYLS